MTFSYLCNRSTSVFSAALRPVGGVPWKNGSRDVDLLYFDRFGGKAPPEGLTSSRTLFDRAHTIGLNNKLLLGRTLQANGVEYPRHYFHPDAVPADPASWWYVKDPLSTGCKRLWLCRHHEVAEFFQPGYVIQQAVLDVALHLERKFTIRCYVLVYKGSVYWYPDGFLMLHGAPYQADLPDPEAHFSHIGYLQPDSPIRLIPTREYRPWYKLELPIIETIQTVFGFYGKELGKSNPLGSYCLFGMDLLQCADGRINVIAINDRPTMTHLDHINTQVNQPMLQAMVQVLLPEKVSPKPATAFEELMFYE